MLIINPIIFMRCFKRFITQTLTP